METVVVKRSIQTWTPLYKKRRIDEEELIIRTNLTSTATPQESPQVEQSASAPVASSSTDVETENEEYFTRMWELILPREDFTGDLKKQRKQILRYFVSERLKPSLHATNKDWRVCLAEADDTLSSYHKTKLQLVIVENIPKYVKTPSSRDPPAVAPAPVVTISTSNSKKEPDSDKKAKWAKQHIKSAPHIRPDHMDEDLTLMDIYIDDHFVDPDFIFDLVVAKIADEDLKQSAKALICGLAGETLDYEEFKTDLRMLNNNSSTLAKEAHKFYTMTPKVGESVEKYHTRLLNLAKILNKSGKEVVERLLQSIPHGNTKLTVSGKLSNCNDDCTLVEASNLLRGIATLLAINSITTYNAIKPKDASRPGGKQPHKKNPNEFVPTQAKGKKVVCWACNVQGHPQHKCPGVAEGKFKLNQFKPELKKVDPKDAVAPSTFGKPTTPGKRHGNKQKKKKEKNQR